jgi:hypothetical protein
MKTTTKNTTTELTTFLFNGEYVSMDKINDLYFFRKWEYYRTDGGYFIMGREDYVVPKHYSLSISESLQKIDLNDDYYNKLSRKGFSDRSTNKIDGNCLYDSHDDDY